MKEKDFPITCGIQTVISLRHSLMVSENSNDYSFDIKVFEILGITSGRDEFEARPIKRYLNPIQVNRNGTTSNGSKANTRATIVLPSVPDDIYYLADNASGPLQILYARILIRHVSK